MILALIVGSVADSSTMLLHLLVRYFVIVFGIDQGKPSWFRQAPISYQIFSIKLSC